MKIGFLGVGQVGGTLARKLGAKGHSVFLVSREAKNQKLFDLSKEIGANAQVELISSALEKSDVIILATPWSAVDEIIKNYSARLKGKVLIDCTNPLMPDLSGLVALNEKSAGEHIQKSLPDTKVVKAFNTVGFNIMANPTLEGRKVAMYFCGNDERARFLTQQLIADVGFQPVDAGDMSASRLLEPFALLWIKTAYKFGMGRGFAFSLVKQN